MGMIYHSCFPLTEFKLIHGCTWSKLEIYLKLLTTTSRLSLIINSLLPTQPLTESSP